MANTILVKDIPDNIFKEISKEQASYRANVGPVLSQSKAIIKMLRDYIRCRNLNNFKAE